MIEPNVLLGSVRRLGRMLRDRRISSVELTETDLQRLESIGPRLHHFSEETVRDLKKAYRIIFRSALTLQKALGTLKEDEISQTPEVQHLIDFIQNSERRITR